VLQRYLHYLRCERHLSETTVKNHRVHLIPFLESLGTPLAAPWSRSTPSQLEFVVGLMLAALLHHGF
jgi:site-specific recombinase XerC